MLRIHSLFGMAALAWALMTVAAGPAEARGPHGAVGHMPGMHAAAPAVVHPQFHHTPNFRPQFHQTPNFRPQFHRMPGFQPQFHHPQNFHHRNRTIFVPGFYGFYGYPGSMYGYSMPYYGTPYYGGSYSYSPNYYYGSSPSYLYNPPDYSNFDEGYAITAEPAPVAPSGQLAAPAANRARLEVIVPKPDAAVWLDGHKMVSGGTKRFYDSPPIELGKTYTYDVTTTWGQDGKIITKEKKAEVAPGKLAVVDFTLPSPTESSSAGR